MTNLIATDSAKQELGTLLYFFDIEASSSTTIRYHPGVSGSLANLLWYAHGSPYAQVTYAAMPIEIEGQSKVSLGSPQRPNLTVGIAATTFSSDLASANIYNYSDLVGKKVTIRTTLDKYIKGGSADTGAGNAPVEFPKATYLIESVASLKKESVIYELTSPFDAQGIVIPNRLASANLCSWVYKGINLSNIGSEYSACHWTNDGDWNVGGSTMQVYFNSEDEPIIAIPNNSFTTYSSGAITLDTLYKTTSTESRIGTDGSTSNVTVNNYWQATVASSSPGTPSDTNANFRRVRVYSAYSSSTTYYAYEDAQHNEYVRDSSGAVWKVGSTISGEAPGFNAYWAPGDLCGKKLNSCAVRYGVQRVTSGSTSPPKNAIDTSIPLPFGGFPGLARKFLT